MTAEVLERLFQTIESRREADPQTSYTAKLFSKGTQRIAQKVGEEAVETVIFEALAKTDAAPPIPPMYLPPQDAAPVPGPAKIQVSQPAPPPEDASPPAPGTDTPW